MDRVEQLEQTILEMGSEIYRLKSEIASLKDGQGKIMKLINGIKHFFDERGIVSEDEFDIVSDIVNELKELPNSVDSASADLLDKLKKIGH